MEPKSGRFTKGDFFSLVSVEIQVPVQMRVTRPSSFYGSLIRRAFDRHATGCSPCHGAFVSKGLPGGRAFDDLVKYKILLVGTSFKNETRPASLNIQKIR